MSKVVVIDTSILCVWLQIPAYTSCGPDKDHWDFQRINEKIELEIEEASTLVLPLATIIETGNHISQSTGDRYSKALAFCDILLKSVDSTHPWAAFSEQGELWNDENLRKLSTIWPNRAAAKVSLGDATITDVAEYYAKSGYLVEIFTGDQGLKAFEPSSPPPVPRRRK